MSASFSIRSECRAFIITAKRSQAKRVNAIIISEKTLETPFMASAPINTFRTCPQKIGQIKPCTAALSGNDVAIASRASATVIIWAMCIDPTKRTDAISSAKSAHPAP